MADLERKYIIPLRKQWLKAPYYKRTKKAIKAIKEFSMKHMKAEEAKIGTYLNEFVHRHGRKNPPHKVEVLIKKPENQNYVEVELPDAPKKEEIKEEKTTMEKIKDKIPGKKDTKEKKKEEPEKTKVEKVETSKQKEEKTKKQVLESPKPIKKEPPEEVPKAEELAKKKREQIPKIDGKEKSRI